MSAHGAMSGNAMENLLGPLRQWYAGLQTREQWLVSRGSLAAVLLLLLGGGMQLHAAVTKARAAVVRKQDDLAFIISHLDQLRAAAGHTPDLETPLPALVERTAKDAGLGDPLKSTEPEGTTGVRVKFDGVPFDALVLWLSSLQQDQAVHVDNATIDKSAAGNVVATLVLSRG